MEPSGPDPLALSKITDLWPVYTVPIPKCPQYFGWGCLSSNMKTQQTVGVRMSLQPPTHCRPWAPGPCSLPVTLAPPLAHQTTCRADGHCRSYAPTLCPCWLTQASAQPCEDSHPCVRVEELRHRQVPLCATALYSMLCFPQGRGPRLDPP